MSESSDPQPEDRASASKPVDWQHLIVGALTGVSLIGAAVSSWNTGRASQSADNAAQAKYVTLEAAERARERLDKFEEEQKAHDTQLEELDRRIDKLEAVLKHP